MYLTLSVHAILMVCANKHYSNSFAAFFVKKVSLLLEVIQMLYSSVTVPR